MAGLKIKNETVYVIYRNGEPYQKAGRKIVYTTRGAANGIITTDVAEEVWQKHKKECRENGVNIDLYQNWGEIEIAENKMRQEFDIVEYGPKRGGNHE